MPLVDLIYRCPVCGGEDVLGQGRSAECGACGTRVSHVGEGGRVSVLEPGRKERIVTIAELVAVDPGPTGLDGDGAGLASSSGPVSREAAVTARRSRGEDPVWYRKALLGFVERLESPRPGTLRLDDETLTFEGVAGETRRWELGEIRAVQTSSSAVQVSLPEGGLVSFRFESDSPRQWEDLIKARLQAIWRRRGLGEIVEYQPRIRS